MSVATLVTASRDARQPPPAPPAALPTARPAAWRLALRSPVVRAALTFLAAVTLAAAAAPLLGRYDPLDHDLSTRVSPISTAHWLGTDQYGRDVLSRLMWGGRISLAVGVVAVLIGSAGGIVLGLLAGYFGGKTDQAISRLMDALLAFPTILMALTLIAALGTGLLNVMVAVGVTIVPNVGRLVRGSALSIREMDYVLAARALGAPGARILALHILPNVLSHVIVYASLAMPGAILAEAALSFLGVGVDPPTPTWGAVIGDGRELLSSAPWIATSSAVLIMLTVVAINFVGDALRDALDPRLRSMARRSL
jgi:ABC-type dipeptide/oligopeptide/nickel transport system permease subunit